ncbi:hypothetical protein MP638_000544, partial [Amoeboaphelidium occidentale]
EYLYSGGNDRIIRKWNITSGVSTTLLIGHSNAVLCLQLRTAFLFSGSHDTSTRMWDTESSQNIQMFYATTSVQAINLLDDKIIVGTGFGLLMFFIPTGETLVDLRENFGCLCLVSSSFRLFSGHIDGLIFSRDFNTLSSLETYQGHQDIVRALVLTEIDVLFSVSDDGTIKRWN